MAFNKSRVGTFYDKEILKYVTGLEATQNIVIDGTTVPVDSTSGRYVMQAGTVVAKISASTKVQPAAASGVSASDIVGILTHTVEFFYPVETNVTDEPAAVYFHECIFDITKLVNYSGNASAVQTALKTCLFQ